MTMVKQDPQIDPIYLYSCLFSFVSNPSNTPVYLFIFSFIYLFIFYPDPPSHLPLHPIPLGLPSAPGLNTTCLMHPAWADDLFHPR